jgi:hypothetical protein
MDRLQERCLCAASIHTKYVTMEPYRTSNRLALFEKIIMKSHSLEESRVEGAITGVDWPIRIRNFDPRANPDFGPDSRKGI